MSETMEWEATMDNLGYPETRTTCNIVTVKAVMDIIMMDVDVVDMNLGDDSKRQVVVVPDTNIFIHSLLVLREILNENENSKDLMIILPWMVLQELDRLRKKYKSAQVAINFINELLVKKHPRLKPQRPSEVAEASAEFCGSNDDDSILQCALNLCGKLTHGHILFITNDKNLRSKAMVATKDNLTVCDGTSAQQRVHYLLRNNDNVNQIPIRRKSSSSSSLHERRPSRPKVNRDRIKRSIPSEATSPTRKSTRKRNHSPCSTPVSDQSLMFSPMRKKSSKEIPKIGITCTNFGEISKVLRETISYIIEFQMKEDFGDNWLKCLKILPPWTCETGLKCILAHWIAVFSFVFGKSKNSAEKLHDKIRLNRNFFRDALNEPSISTQKEILELFIELLNAADFNKSTIIKEIPFVQYKRTTLNYIRNLKEESG